MIKEAAEQKQIEVLKQKYLNKATSASDALVENKKNILTHSSSDSSIVYYLGTKKRNEVIAAEATKLVGVLEKHGISELLSLISMELQGAVSRSRSTDPFADAFYKVESLTKREFYNWALKELVFVRIIESV